MSKYRNVSAAPWQRSAGVWVPPGATFDATPREHERILRRPAYQKRLELVGGNGNPAVVGGGEVWPLKMSPEMYLRLHPQGPNAALAKDMLADAATTVSEE